MKSQQYIHGGTRCFLRLGWTSSAFEEHLLNVKHLTQSLRYVPSSRELWNYTWGLWMFLQFFLTHPSRNPDNQKFHGVGWTNEPRCLGLVGGLNVPEHHIRSPNILGLKTIPTLNWWCFSSAWTDFKYPEHVTWLAKRQKQTSTKHSDSLIMDMENSLFVQ